MAPILLASVGSQAPFRLSDHRGCLPYDGCIAFVLQLKTQNRNQSMIIDSFLFNGELDMLEFRLGMLWDHVDKFVIVESDHTFSGMPKPFHFRDNFTRFQWAEKKIVYSGVSFTPDQNPWKNEAGHREQIVSACRQFSDNDLLIISDVDEIPTPAAIRFEVESDCPTRVCEQFFFYYNLRTLRKEVWRGSIFCRLGVARQHGVQFMRNRRGYWEPIKNAGWHLSYFGDPSYIREKIESFSHQEYNTSEFTNEQHIRACLDNGLDLFKRGTESLCPPPGFFPDYFLEKAKPYDWGLMADSGNSHKETGTTNKEPVSMAGNVLIIDHFLPAFDRDSASLRLFWLMGLLKQQQCHITFFAGDERGREKYRRALQEMGVEVYATAPGMLEATGGKTEADPTELKKILTSMSCSVAWLASHDIARRYLPAVRSLSPSTAIVIDAGDAPFSGMAIQAGGPTALEVYRQADALITVTEHDRRHVESYLPEKLHFVVPNILPLPETRESSPNRSGLLFIGDFNHNPHADAIGHFIDEMFPLIKNTIADITLWVVGSNPPGSLRELCDGCVIVTGNVPSTDPYLRKARVFVAPSGCAAGMEGKIAEAMAYGLPVVTTSAGAGKMGLTPGETALIADTPEELAKRVVELYADDSLWLRISEKSRLFIKDNHSPEHVYRVVRNMMTRLSLLFQCRMSHENRPGIVPAGRRLPEPEASIVILARNQADHTALCLQSIKRHTNIPHEIIVVDNNSTDDTLTFLSHWSRDNANLKVIVNNTNRGFAAGNNQGISLASGKYIVLLNNDTVVTPGWLERMIDVLERFPGTGITGPVSNNVSGPQLVQEADYCGLDQLELYAARHAALNAGQTEPYPRLVAFCLVIEREVLDRIGGLDERFGLGNFEDDDYCLRAWLSGFRPRIARGVFIHHAGSVTVKQEGLDNENSWRQSWKIFLEKWGLPSDLSSGTYEFGDQNIKAAPVYIPFPDLGANHAADSSRSFWCETGRSSDRPLCEIVKGVRCER